MASLDHSFEAFLSSAKLDAYSAAFTEYGYDDLELIDSMTDEERQEMFKKSGTDRKTWSSVEVHESSGNSKSCS